MWPVGTFPPNRWNRITSFHLPSRILSACSTLSAAEVDVSSSPLPFGEYLTFSCVLVIWNAQLHSPCFNLHRNTAIQSIAPYRGETTCLSICQNPSPPTSPQTELTARPWLSASPKMPS